MPYGNDEQSYFKGFPISLCTYKRGCRGTFEAVTTCLVILFFKVFILTPKLNTISWQLFPLMGEVFLLFEDSICLPFFLLLFCCWVLLLLFIFFLINLRMQFSLRNLYTNFIEIFAPRVPRDCPTSLWVISLEAQRQRDLISSYICNTDTSSKHASKCNKIQWHTVRLGLDGRKTIFIFLERDAAS